MKGKTQLIVVALCLIVTLGITVFDFKTGQDDLASKLKHYQETTALVKKVHPAVVTKYGDKQPTYDLKVRLTDSTEVSLHRRKLKTRLEEGDSIRILYNPEFPQDDIYLKE